MYTLGIGLDAETSAVALAALAVLVFGGRAEAGRGSDFPAVNFSGGIVGVLMLRRSALAVAAAEAACAEGGTDGVDGRGEERGVERGFTAG